MEKVLVVVTAVGALLIVAAVAFFSLTGSSLGRDLLLSSAGFVSGMAPVSLLTRSPVHGRLVAFFLLALLITACLALFLAAASLVPTLIEDHQGWARFLSGLVGAVGGVALLRLFGLNLLGTSGDDRESQESRRSS